jgi:hypothetical protein
VRELRDICGTSAGGTSSPPIYKKMSRTLRREAYLTEPVQQPCGSLTGSRRMAKAVDTGGGVFMEVHEAHRGAGLAEIR